MRRAFFARPSKSSCTAAVLLAAATTQEGRLLKKDGPLTTTAAAASTTLLRSTTATAPSSVVLCHHQRRDIHGGSGFLSTTPHRLRMTKIQKMATEERNATINDTLKGNTYVAGRRYEGGRVVIVTSGKRGFTVIETPEYGNVPLRNASSPFRPWGDFEDVENSGAISRTWKSGEGMSPSPLRTM